MARRALNAAGVALAALALGLAGCSDALPTTPTPATRTPIGQRGQVGGSGGGGESPEPAVPVSLVGSWEVLLVFTLPDDVVTTRTTWRFDADGACSRTVTTFSVAEGVPIAGVRSCTFATGPAVLVVSYTGGEVARFGLSLLLLPDTIVLDGLAYQRVR